MMVDKPSRLNKKIRFAGLCLMGGQTNKSSLALLEYYPEFRKLFLVQFFEKLSSNEELSEDKQIVELLNNKDEQIHSTAITAPLTLPKCLRCRLVCPGYEICKEAEIKWLRNFYKKRNQIKRPSKGFTPYTQRCVETYLMQELEESFELSHALGANDAPKTARALFLQRQIRSPIIEVSPKISVWRMGQSLGVAKKHLRLYRQAATGNQSREVFLKAFVEKDLAFFYHQDLNRMVEYVFSFEAFIAAYTVFLKYIRQTEPRLKGLPKKENWIYFPKKNWIVL